MAEASIPVDLFNPGQVFACLGFLEAAEVLLGEAEGGFDWSDAANVNFILRAAGDENPFAAVLAFVKEARVEWLTHDQNVKERDGGFSVLRESISDSESPKEADLPALMTGKFRGEDRKVYFGYWADGSSRFSTTFKKSTNGASSHIRFNNAHIAIAELNEGQSAIDPFEQKARTESLFRLDPRGSVDPINGGTSPDKLRKGSIDVRVATYPVCEALALVGLQNARPGFRERGAFHYYAWSRRDKGEQHCHGFLPLVLARAAISVTLPFLAARCFVVQHEEVKKGGDRKMTQIYEEMKHD